MKFEQPKAEIIRYDTVDILCSSMYHQTTDSGEGFYEETLPDEN